jgi:L-asparaginase
MENGDIAGVESLLSSNDGAGSIKNDRNSTITGIESLLSLGDAGRIDEAIDEDLRFSFSRPFQLFSENMNPVFWNRLIEHLRSLDFEAFDALFITHGTDTLAYTSNLLALLFWGIDTPVFLISSDKPLSHERANGIENLREAIRTVKTGCPAGVYVPYRNADGIMHVHRGERLLQPADFSDDFTSVTHPSVNDLSRIVSQLRPNAASPLLYTVQELKTRVTAIRPYPGLRYDIFDLSNTDVILHGSYHSFTASDINGSAPTADMDGSAIPYESLRTAADRVSPSLTVISDMDGSAPPYESLRTAADKVSPSLTAPSDMDGSAPELAHYSLKGFARKAHKQKIDVCFAPILSQPERIYASTRDLLDSGLIRPLYDMSFEMAYAFVSTELFV